MLQQIMLFFDEMLVLEGEVLYYIIRALYFFNT